MIKEENAELLINGKRIEGDYTFTATDTKMEVQVSFTFDASELAGKSLVTFEELYDISNPEEPKKVAEHKDITDDGQTVTFKEKPTTPPEEPEKPSTPEKPNTPPSTHTDSPKTGDNTQVGLFLGMLGVSAAGLLILAYKKRRSLKSH